jgi:hypothetical protein
LEWSYDGTPYGKLEVGMCAIFRGEMTARTSQDGEIKRRFVIVKYSPDSSTSELVKEEASARRSSKPALPRYDRAPVVDPDEVPF